MNNIDYKTKVFQKIHSKEISMRPRIYFLIKLAVIAVLTVLLFAGLIFTLSFIFFSIHESGEQFLLGFGVHGVIVFFQLFPWVILLLCGVVFLLLEWTLRRFKFSYRLPILRVFVYTSALTIILSILFTFVPVHTAFLRRAEVGQLPLIGRVYEAIHDSHQDKGIVRGEVTTIGTQTIVISHNDTDTDEDDGTWNVVLPPDVTGSDFYIGEKVYVAGTIIDGSMHAYGIHEVASDE